MIFRGPFLVSPRADFLFAYLMGEALLCTKRTASTRNPYLICSFFSNLASLLSILNAFTFIRYDATTLQFLPAAIFMHFLTLSQTMSAMGESNECADEPQPDFGGEYESDRREDHYNSPVRRLIAHFNSIIQANMTSSAQRWGPTAQDRLEHSRTRHSVDEV